MYGSMSVSSPELILFQGIMLNLQEKAHYSLNEFRKGSGKTLVRHVSVSDSTSGGEDDELAMLGGKTRLVKPKDEPISPEIIHRSPTSHNPVVPLPLPSSTNSQIDPNVFEYLSSFHSHQPQPLSASSHNSFSDVDISPVALYGMPSFAEPNSYSSQSNMVTDHQAHSPVHYRQQSNLMSNGNGAPLNSFPQYFPVYDYGLGSMENGYGNAAPILDIHPGPGGLRRSSSGSPEANMMHSTWQDFVAGLAMNQ